MRILILCFLLEFSINYICGFQMTLEDGEFDKFEDIIARFLSQNDPILTTTPAPACVNTWKQYTGTENISSDGVQAGFFESNPVYVGKAIILGNYNPVTIHFNPIDDYCIYISSKTCTKSFYFLTKVKTYQYDWVSSQNGDYEVNAIDGTAAIGRITKNSTTSVGSLLQKEGLSYRDQSTYASDLATNGYDVLTCIDLSAVVTDPTTTPDNEETTMDSTTFDPEDTTIIDTTTPEIYENCRNSWDLYTGSEDLSLFGVQAGTFDSNPVYIGAIEINSVVVSGPIFTDSNGVYYMDNGNGNYTNNFHYLRKIISINYSWIDSRNGFDQLNSVFAQLPVGKISKNGDEIVGSILTDLGLIYLNESSYSWHFTRENYQILTCTYLDVVYTTTPPPDQEYTPRQSCNHSWVDYTGNENLLKNGVIAGYKGSHPSYISLVNISGVMLLGQVYRKSANKYCVDIGDIKCSNKFKFLQKGNLYYKWKSSLESKYYKYRAFLKYSSTLLPIVRMGWSNDNLTIGLGLGEHFMAFLNESTHNWYVAGTNHQMLLCSEDSEIFTEVPTDLTTTTTEKIETTTNIDFTTTILPETCVNHWVDYTGSEDLHEHGVSVGRHKSHTAYIGQVNISGLIVPGIVRSKSKNKFYIDIGDDKCEEEFQYLYNSAYNDYRWINSDHGKDEENAVKISSQFGSFAIGRIRKGNKISIGFVFPGHGLVLTKRLEDHKKILRGDYELNYGHLVKDHYEVLTCSLEDEEEETTTMEVDTTTYMPPETNDDYWIDYTGIENLAEFGVYAGRYNSKPTYVGKKYISGLLVPGIIRKRSKGTYCIDIGNEHCEDEFQYLYRTDEISYKWIDSSDGKDEENSVNISNIFGTFAIGRVRHKRRLTLGLVYSGHGLGINEKSKDFIEFFNRRHEILYNHFIKHHYQVLVRSSDQEETTEPTEEPTTTPSDILTTTEPPQNCENLWTEYTGSEDLSTDGVLVGVSDSKPVYLGRASISGRMIPGVVHSKDKGYCIKLDKSECLDKFEFFYNTRDYDYEWIDSQINQYVENAVQTVIFSIPLAIGKFSENGQLFVGLVVPGAGLAFLNESVYNWYVAKSGYQVLTCPDIIGTTTIPIEETTTTEVEETTVVDTTTAKNDHYCDNHWVDYTGTEDLSEYGVHAGRYKSKPTYIGLANISGTIVPGIVRSKSKRNYCIDIENDHCDDEFQYLYKVDDNKYKWTYSKHGRDEENAVKISSQFGSFAIGRIRKGNKISIGFVFPGHGLVLTKRLEDHKKILRGDYELNYGHLVKDHYEVLTCSLEDEEEETTTMEVDTTTYMPPETNDDYWIDYTGIENLAEFGVYAGRYNSKPTYVGKKYISGLLVPGIIRKRSKGTYCIDIGNEHCEDEFQYLYRTDEISYKWIDSSDGKDEENSVNISNIFGTFAIGRVRHKRRLTLGLVYSGHGLGINEKSKDFIEFFNRRHEILYNHFIKHHYQVLVRSSDQEETTEPTEEPTTTPSDILTTTEPPQNCENLWTEYTGSEDLSTDGVLVGVSDSKPVYLGRASISGRMIPGVVHSKDKGYCIKLDKSECLDKFEFFYNTRDYDYEWIDSQINQYVENAVQTVIFSIPLAIGKFSENGQLFVGLVVPGAGLAFLNESVYNWYVAKSGYQVLTCPDIIETTTIPIEETTTTEVEETTVVDTTTAKIDHYCAETWIKYSGVENITADGVFGGYYDSSPVYVGQVINNSRPNPVWIQPDRNGGYCVKNDDADCRKDFKFLREPVDLVYKWTESANGELKENDVKMEDTGTIARLQKYEKIHIGVVYPRSGFMSVHTEFSFIVDGYEVLRCYDGDFITKTSTEISTPDTTISISDSTTTSSDTTTTISDTTTTLRDSTTISSDSTTISSDSTTISSDMTTTLSDTTTSSDTTTTLSDTTTTLSDSTTTLSDFTTTLSDTTTSSDTTTTLSDSTTTLSDTTTTLSDTTTSSDTTTTLSDTTTTLSDSTTTLSDTTTTLSDTTTISSDSTTISSDSTTISGDTTTTISDTTTTLSDSRTTLSDTTTTLSDSTTTLSDTTTSSDTTTTLSDTTTTLSDTTTISSDSTTISSDSTTISGDTTTTVSDTTTTLSDTTTTLSDTTTTLSDSTTTLSDTTTTLSDSTTTLSDTTTSSDTTTTASDTTTTLSDSTTTLSDTTTTLSDSTTSSDTTTTLSDTTMTLSDSTTTLSDTTTTLSDTTRTLSDTTTISSDSTTISSDTTTTVSDTTTTLSDSTTTLSDTTTTLSDSTTTLSDTTTLIDTTTISTTTATPFVTVSVFTRPTIAVPASTVPITPPTSGNSGQDAELKGIYQGLNQAYGLIDSMSGLMNRMFESVTIMSDAAHQTHEQIKSLTNYCQQNKC